MTSILYNVIYIYFCAYYGIDQLSAFDTYTTATQCHVFSKLGYAVLSGCLLILSYLGLLVFLFNFQHVIIFPYIWTSISHLADIWYSSRPSRSELQLVLLTVISMYASGLFWAIQDKERRDKPRRRAASDKTRSWPPWLWKIPYDILF